MAKILIHTLGSSGDFNPFMALALELRRRGHVIHWAVGPQFAEKARAQGFAATVAGKDPEWDSDTMRRLLAAHLTDPIKIMFKELLIPDIVPATEALEPLVREADLFLSHTIQLAAPAVADRTGVPWISASAATLIHETTAYPPPGVAWKGCPAFLSRLGWEIGYRIFGDLDALAAAEYRKLGVAPRPNVISGGAYSRRLTLGLWSPSFFPRPADWSNWFQVGGYARWDGEEPTHNSDPIPGPFTFVPGLSLPSEGRVPSLRGGIGTPASPLLGAGGASPRILFTLGSSVVNHPGEFWATALHALTKTNWHGILLGAPEDLPLPRELRGRVQVIRYAPYAEIFPQADAVVHQGGVGTTQAACYYGIPSLIVPRGFDQFENAAHIQREGWGLRLMPQDFSASGLRFRLERLLASDKIKAAVTDLSRRMQAEPGVEHSADLVEAAMAGQRKP
ncbi:MAG: glycosyltransferase [Armatimonadota bacterium]|nr:glycosyltransferase [Armatimonadota bacterium]